MSFLCSRPPVETFRDWLRPFRNHSGIALVGLLLAGLILFTASGCRPSQEDQPQAPVDSVSAGELPPQSPREMDHVPTGTSPPDSIPGPPPEDESQLAPLDSLRSRILRLETENDSLRATVGVILSQAPARNAIPMPSQDSARSDSATGTLGLAGEVLPVDTTQVQNWGLRIAVSLVFLVLTGLFVRSVVWLLERLAERHTKRRLFFKRLVPIVRIFTWFLAVLFVALLILRIEAQGLLAAGAAVGVAVGFAAQDILKNIFGGLIVLFDQPFQVGDKISVAGTYGEVVSIGLRSTRIVTSDDNLVSVPNSQIVDGQVANANAGELNCQVVTDLFLPGWVDESRAKAIAFEAAASSRYVFLNKPIVVLVKDEFRETFLTHLKVKAYVMDPRLEFLFMSDVTERARAGFRAAGMLGPMHGVRTYVELNRFMEDPHGPGPRNATEAARERATEDGSDDQGRGQEGGDP